MALMLCPDCGGMVSTKATTCVHCGFPLGNAETQTYALLLLAPDPNDPQMTRRLQEVTGLTPAEVDSLRAHLPAVLKRGLPYRDCAALTELFSSITQLSILPDEDVDVPALLSNARPLQREQVQPPRPLGFWSLVGAILTALFFWSLLSSFLGILFLR